MERETSIEDLIESLSALMEAQRDHDEARKSYDGYSWDWYGAGLIYEVNKHRDRLSKRLESYIDSRVEKVLNAKTADA